VVVGLLLVDLFVSDILTHLFLDHLANRFLDVVAKPGLRFDFMTNLAISSILHSAEGS
jgi:hypothetical protein